MLENISPEWIGYGGAFFTTVAYMPQVIKVVREKHTKSISLTMYIMNAVGIGFWLVYGMLMNSPSILVANICILMMVIAIITMKLRHG